MDTCKMNVSTNPHTTLFLPFAFFHSKIIWLKGNEQLCLIPILHKMQNRSLVHCGGGEELCNSRKEINVIFQNKIAKSNKRKNPYLNNV